MEHSNPADGAQSYRKVLRPREAAAYIGLRPQTLANRRCQGMPPQFVSLGSRAVGYMVNDLDAFLASRKRTSTSDTKEC